MLLWWFFKEREIIMVEFAAGLSVGIVVGCVLFCAFMVYLTKINKKHDK